MYPRSLNFSAKMLPSLLVAARHHQRAASPLLDCRGHLLDGAFTENDASCGREFKRHASLHRFHRLRRLDLDALGFGIRNSLLRPWSFERNSG